MELRMPDGFLPWENFVLKPGVARRKKFGKVFRGDDMADRMAPVIGVDEGASFWRLRPYDLIARIEGGYVLCFGKTWQRGWFICKKTSGYLGTSIPFSAVCRLLAKSCSLETDEWCVTSHYSGARAKLRSFLTKEDVKELEADFTMRYIYKKKWHDANIEFLFRSGKDIYATCFSHSGTFEIIRLKQFKTDFSDEIFRNA